MSTPGQLPVQSSFDVALAIIAATLVLMGLALLTFIAHWFVLLTRTLVRRHRGQCIRCGYDLRGTPGRPCPECGQGRREVGF